MARLPTGQIIERDGKRGRAYAIRVRAGGRRHYISTTATTHAEAEVELANVLADIRRGIWRPPTPEPELARTEEPSFHLYASEWVDRRRPEVDARTVEYFKWALSGHLLPYFMSMRPSEITPAAIKAYRAQKLAAERPLSATSVNKTLKILGQILDDAIDDGYITTNPARGRKTRARASKPKRTWLELDEVRAVLDAAGAHRALLATMILGGLRVGELCALRWRAVDLARSRLTVEARRPTPAGGSSTCLRSCSTSSRRTRRRLCVQSPTTSCFPRATERSETAQTSAPVSWRRRSPVQTRRRERPASRRFSRA